VSTKYDLFLEGSFTFPGHVYCRGCDAIASSIEASDEHYICEIKSIDETPSGWLSHPKDEAIKNPELFEVREYWLNQKKSNRDSQIPADSFAWAFVIAGQLEQYFLRECTLKYKKHKNMTEQPYPQVPTLVGTKKRCLIFDGYYKDVLNKTIEILKLENPEIEEYQDHDRDWLKVCMLKYEKPVNSDHGWFLKYPPAALNLSLNNHQSDDHLPLTSSRWHQ